MLALEGGQSLLATAQALACTSLAMPLLCITKDFKLLYSKVLSRIATTQTLSSFVIMQKSGKSMVYIITSQDYHQELLSAVKWFISSCQDIIRQTDKILL